MLCIYTHIYVLQSILDNLPFHRITLNRSSIVDQYVDRLDHQFDKYASTLIDARHEVHDYYSKVPLDMRVFHAWKECCRLRADELR